MDFDDLLLNWEAPPRPHGGPGVLFQPLYSTSWSTNTRTPTGFRRTSSICWRPGTGTSWWWGTTRRASIPSGARTSPISCISRTISGEEDFQAGDQLPEHPGDPSPGQSSIVNNEISSPRSLTWSEAPESAGPGPVQDVLEQADFVAQKIQEIRGEGMPLWEIAVLYRAHYPLHGAADGDDPAGIPFQIRSGLRFFEQAHIKDVTPTSRSC